MEEEKGFKRFDAPKPVAVGDVVDVTIESVGGQGDGIAKVSGFVVFVKSAKKGETCKVKISEVKRTYAVGEKVGAADAPAEAPSEEEKEEAPEEEPAEEAEEEEEAPAEEETEEVSDEESSEEDAEEEKEE